METIRQRDQQLAAIIARVSALEAELATYKNKKNSNNSHTPPSRDENRPAKKNQSLRIKTNKQAGGQPGHQGKTLDCTIEPDSHLSHMPSFCSCCGNDLAGVPEVLISTRKMIDIPVIKPVCIAHHTYRKTCSCGQVCDAGFPAHVAASVQYGPQIESLVSYLHARQFLPYERMKEFFTDVLNVPLSAGSINNMLERFTRKAMPFYEQIKSRICRARSLGTDETGVRVAGQKHWIWTWQNEALTYVVHSASRGFQTIANQFAHGLPNAVLGHDRWAPHFNCPAAHHQICTAHLLRDLQYIQDLYGERCPWATQMRATISAALKLKTVLTAELYKGVSTQRDSLESQLEKLLHTDLEKSFPKARTLQKSLRRHQDYILHFLHDADVPPDNNGSERAIRNIKVKQKISGQFRSARGADGFAVIRSIIDTTIKSGQNVLNALSLIAVARG